MDWKNTQSIISREYKCAYCGNVVASSTGYHGKYIRDIHICPHCDHPTFFFGDRQVPDTAPGSDVGHVPKDLDALYQEARNCVSVGAFTGSVLLCRKLLMNIAVSQNATGGGNFVTYVDYLAENGFIPPNGRGWVDHIRKKGNEATHEIALMQKEDAEELIIFSEMLMRFIYEFPSKVPNTDDP